VRGIFLKRMCLFLVCLEMVIPIHPLREVWDEQLNLLDRTVWKLGVVVSWRGGSKKGNFYNSLMFPTKRGGLKNSFVQERGQKAMRCSKLKAIHMGNSKLPVFFGFQQDIAIRLWESHGSPKRWKLPVSLQVEKSHTAAMRPAPLPGGSEAMSQFLRVRDRTISTGHP